MKFLNKYQEKLFKDPINVEVIYFFYSGISNPITQTLFPKKLSGLELKNVSSTS